MSELTKEEIDPLQKCLQWLSDNPESPVEDCMSMADVAGYLEELLTLRSLRDAGDEDFREKLEQVDDWIGKVPVAHLDSVFERDARIALSEMEKMYITRGQQLREALEEIERLKCESQKNFMAFTQEAMKSGVKTELRDQETQSLRSQIEALTAELAVLKSCPAMAEVDAILNDTEKSSEQIESELADLARRSIASREEVVGLLRWLIEFSGIILDEVATFDSEVGHNANRILEIVEGK